MRLRPGFAPALTGYDLAALDAAAGAVFALDADLVIAATNPAWDRFAADNGGDARRWSVGVALLDAISGPLRGYFTAAYQEVIDGGAVWHHDYECSSANEFRSFRLTAYPLPRRQGVLVVNTLAVASAHTRLPMTDDPLVYRDAHGLLHQCSHCRRLRRHDDSRWDWVPAVVEASPRSVSHGLCPPCLDHFYPATP